MAGRKVPILCYWDGQINNGAEGIDYEGPPPRVIRASNEIKMTELVEMIYGVTGWDKRDSDVEIVGRYLAGTTPTRCFIPLPVLDDASLASMFDVLHSVQSGWNCIQLYLTRKPVVNDIAIDVSQCAQGGGDACTPPSVSVDDGHGLIKGSGNLTRVLEGTHSSGNEADRENVDGSDVMLESEIDRSNGDHVADAAKQGGSATQSEGDLYVGQKFDTKDELRVAVKLYSMNINRQYRVKDTSPTLLVLKCIHRQTCPWHLRAVRTESHDFEVIKLRGPHTCDEPITDKDSIQLDSNFVAHEMKDFAVAGLSIKAIQKVIASRYNHEISYMVAWSARNKALEKFHGQPFTAKAGPGRPRKNQSPGVDSAGSSHPVIVKRRPGRKRKVQPCDNTAGSSQPSIVKAKPGRPKKKQQPSDGDDNDDNDEPSVQCN